MTGATVLAAGAVLGVRHALEADHLAAVATLVDEEADRPGLAGSGWRVGASWGVGHSLPIVVLGLAFVALGIELPAAVTALFEALAGVVLILLGARLLRAVASGGLLAAHDHGDRRHAHLSVGDLSLGRTHLHLDGDSFLVGVLHGFVGTGTLVVLLVAAAPSAGTALGFLAGFCALSIATMAAIAALWGRALGTAFPRYLQACAGLLGIAVGASLLVEPAVVHGVV